MIFFKKELKLLCKPAGERVNYVDLWANCKSELLQQASKNDDLLPAYL